MRGIPVAYPSVKPRSPPFCAGVPRAGKVPLPSRFRPSMTLGVFERILQQKDSIQPSHNFFGVFAMFERNGLEPGVVDRKSPPYGYPYGGLSNLCVKFIREWFQSALTHRPRASCPPLPHFLLPVPAAMPQ